MQPLPTIAIEGRVVSDAGFAFVAVARAIAGGGELADGPPNEAVLFVALELLFR